MNVEIGQKAFLLKICKIIGNMKMLTVVFMVNLVVENIGFWRSIKKNFIKNSSIRLIMLGLLMKQTTCWFKECIFDIKFFQRHGISRMLTFTIGFTLTF